MSRVEESFVASFTDLYAVGYRASFAVLGNRADAEECAQEACARALARWSHVQGHAPAWVARVATNQALDRTRRAATATRFAARVVRSDSIAGTEALADKRRDLVAALDALPRRQREMVVLRYLADLSEQQTADVMRCSTGTVKSACSKAMAKLRTQLGPQWAWED